MSLLPLPFPVAELRGPDSYLARIVPSADPTLRAPGREGPLVLVWGEGGAAVVFGDGDDCCDDGGDDGDEDDQEG